MQQITLDIGLHSGPSLDNYFAGANTPALDHLRLNFASTGAAAHRSPVPTFLHGPSGSGKTHLLTAVMYLLQSQGESVGHMTAQHDTLVEYDPAWTLVVLDDIELYNAEQQHQAFTWFVNAQTYRRPVLAAAEAAAVDLRVREDLRTRLGWGHIFALQLLSEPDQRAVLRQAALARGLTLSDEVMDFVLRRFSRDLGSLMDLLVWMDGYALQTKRAITIPLIKSMLDNA